MAMVERTTHYCDRCGELAVERLTIIIKDVPADVDVCAGHLEPIQELHAEGQRVAFTGNKKVRARTFDEVLRDP